MATDVVLNLNPGAFSTFENTDDVTIAFGVVIEQAAGGTGDDTIVGNSIGNRLKGNGGADLMLGGAGNDVLLGGGGSDDMSGGDGNDRLRGGAADDVIRGDGGNDRMAGNAGADTFIFARGDGTDIVTDFQDGIDALEIGGYNFSGAADALAYAIDLAWGVLFEFDDGAILAVRGVTTADIADDMSFV